jgi:hypothetical protein
MEISEMLVLIYKSRRRHIPERSNMSSHTVTATGCNIVSYINCLQFDVVRYAHPAIIDLHVLFCNKQYHISSTNGEEEECI